MTTKKYIVTDKAGPRVAGYVVSKGQPLELTDAQAAYERQLGTIELAPDTAEPEAESVVEPVVEVADEPVERRSKKS